jgi:uncharacterized membrane protein YphA (DoxX/SURF4 family)
MTETSKGRKIGYWVATGLLAAGTAFGGVYDLMAPPEVAEGLEHLGYPAHLATLLGIAKVLAVVTILAPGFARLKEWAYAGITIDLVGAAWSHGFAGDPAGQWVPFIGLYVVLTFASYFLRPSNRRLPDMPSTAR